MGMIATATYAPGPGVTLEAIAELIGKPSPELVFGGRAGVVSEVHSYLYDESGALIGAVLVVNLS